ncbi:glycoside hydrolase family 105 protein [Pedobacter sp. MC2016-24]|uniref:glycoside hydrolase family 88/105 protein n=1 Tax=Pedobacter sp. MC2016-24 TaxID=2780090 RepID=UPI00187E7F4A|nr:glycoside hydrolase family 88 protein [Pedobacter sp. MC2016-24]MBE9598044.1 glycoside hydrolase family 88 protein [Pedobacter sp. MC2016-24]
MNLSSKMRLNILVTTGLFLLSLPVFSQNKEALALAKRVADKVIADTYFSFKLQPQKDVLGLQVIDFRGLKPIKGQYLYGKSQLVVEKKDSLLNFALSYGGEVTIWINNMQVYAAKHAGLQVPKETSYNRFTFSEQFSGRLKNGINEVLIRYTAEKDVDPVIFLMPVTRAGDLNTAASFNSGMDNDLQNTAWLLSTGPFDRSGLTPHAWCKSPQRYLPELETPSHAAYQRDPYADWHYSHGSMVWSIMALDTAGKYSAFAKRYVEFTLQQIPYFRYQYDSLFAFRGSYHRIFRRTMLDDTGAPVLPFAAYYLKTKDEAVKNLILPIAAYVSKAQQRLDDGTFCRPEPVEATVWADDLFMSVPFLLQMAKITGDVQYYNDAARQVLNFRKYLLDPKTGLYKHAWFNLKQERSAAYWGRANGWIAWATVSLLANLPRNHPAYTQVLRNFQEQMKTLIRYQDKSGMWHQVLDRPDAYEETSCTALFTLALARGVREGWLNQDYKKNALAGWNALKTKIDTGGVVHGICRGTDIGDDQQFYMDRKTIANDPRGLGAVITAGIEISRLQP